MKKPAHIAILTILIGITLASTSWWWPPVVGGGRAWSAAQANEYAQAAANLHHLSHEGAAGSSARASSAAARYSRQRDALEQARTAGQTAAAVMQCLGITAIFAGLFALSAVRTGAQPE